MGGSRNRESSSALVFAADRGRKVSRSKERIAVGKTHLIRIEVAAGKVCAADAVIVLLDLPMADCSISKISGRARVEIGRSSAERRCPGHVHLV